MTTVFQAFSLALALGLVPFGALVHGPAQAATPADHPATDTGFLDISSDPPAKIAIDDADTGKLTPQPHLELKVGHHRLTLVTQDGTRKRTIGFNILPGETTKLTLHLAS